MSTTSKAAGIKMLTWIVFIIAATFISNHASNMNEAAYRVNEIKEYSGTVTEIIEHETLGYAILLDVGNNEKATVNTKTKPNYREGATITVYTNTEHSMWATDADTIVEENVSNFLIKLPISLGYFAAIVHFISMLKHWKDCD